MTLTQLEYVLAVNKYRHFGKAAEACHVTQPTLSMQLQKLEEELQVILFDRSKNPVLPTLDGESVISQAQNVIREYKKIFDVIDSHQQKLSGQLHLGVIPTLAPYLIPLFAKSFCQKFPEIELKIEEFQTDDIILKLERDELDAGLLVTPLHHPSVVEKVLFYETFHVFASLGHSLASKTKVKESDLQGDGLWLLTDGHCMRQQMMNICRLKPKGTQVSNLHFESGNLETLMNMVIETGGYTLIPQLALRQLSVKRKKMVLDFQSPVPTREVSLVYGRLFHKERLIEALEAEIILNLPKDIQSHKNKMLSVVEITS